MKKTAISFLCLVGLSLMIGGCASKWEHPIKTESDFAVDKRNCSAEASKLYPPLFYASPFQAGSNYPNITLHTPVYGFSRRGFIFPPTYSWQDYNEPARKSAYRNCLNALGWEWVLQ